MSDQPERQPIMRVDKTKKLTDEEWELVKTLYCNGMKGSEVAERFNISVHTIRQYAKVRKWPTPGRIRLAQKAPQKFTADDPAMALADMWAKRKESSREEEYEGFSKALKRFFAHSPCPTTFQEAALAVKLRKEAIEPDSGKDNTANVNLAILTQQGFKPRRVEGRTIDSELSTQD